jgi:hypothetical protein
MTDSSSNHGPARGNGLESRPDVIQNSPKASAPDFVLEDCGSILFLHPQNQSATDWINSFVSREGYQPNWPSVLLEPRYVSDLIQGLQNDGFVVEAA